MGSKSHPFGEYMQLYFSSKVEKGQIELLRSAFGAESKSKAVLASASTSTYLLNAQQQGAQLRLSYPDGRWENLTVSPTGIEVKEFGNDKKRGK